MEGKTGAPRTPPRPRPDCGWKGQSHEPHRVGMIPPWPGPKLHLNTVGPPHCVALVLLDRGYVWGGGVALDKVGKLGGLGGRLLYILLFQINGEKHPVSVRGPQRLAGPGVLS